MAEANAEEQPSSSRNFFDNEIKGRSRVKHEILQRYLKAWFAIMAQRPGAGDVIYVDGFAGPGKHKNGENGSPLLAYEIATHYKMESNFKGNIKLIFVEWKRKYFKQLEENLRIAESEYRGTNVKYEVIHGEFAKVLERILRENPHAAMLVFADPFGFKGSTMPMRLMQKVMDRQLTEVLINVMDGSANRWFKSELHQPTLAELLGTSDWKESVCAEGIDAQERLQRFMDIYIKQLCRGNRYLRLKFAMKNNINRHIYHLLFVTKHIKGIMIMKNAMWKQSQTNEGYSFSEWAMGKLNVRDPKKVEEDIVSDVVTRIEDHFRGKQEVNGVEIERYIWLETPYDFNFKNKLKKALQTYVLNERKSSAFDMLQFHIPNG